MGSKSLPSASVCSHSLDAVPIDSSVHQVFFKCRRQVFVGRPRRLPLPRGVHDMKGRPKRKWTDDLVDWCNIGTLYRYRLAMDRTKWTHFVKIVIDINGYWAHRARERNTRYRTAGVDKRARSKSTRQCNIVQATLRSDQIACFTKHELSIRFN